MSAGTDYLAKPILDWLRERADGSLAGRKYREAADEIERLRGVLAKAQNDLEDERRQRHFTAGATEKVIRALHAAAVQPTVTTTAGSEKPTYVLANPPPKCPLCGGDYFSHPRLGITHSCATTPMQATGRTPSPTGVAP